MFIPNFWDDEEAGLNKEEDLDMMKPHFGQSDAAMNKLAGCNVLPNANKPADLPKLAGYTKEEHEEAAGMGLEDAFMSHHEQPCDCAICDDIAFRRSLRKKDGCDILGAKVCFACGECLPTNTDEDAWLIEINGDFNAQWLSMDLWSWTSNADDAIRFSRKIDAEAFMSVFVGEHLNAVATSHLWCGSEI